MRVIGVPVADRPECLYSLDVAFSIARELGADVEGFHIVPHSESSDSLSISTLLNAEANTSLWPQISEKEKKAGAVSAGRVFSRVAEEHGYAVTDKNGKPGDPRAVYREKTGSVEKVLPLIGPLTDLLVVTRPSSGKSKKAGIMMMTSLMKTSSPVLVLPSRKSSSRLTLKRIVIAWDRGQTESVLVHYCLPLLKAADEVIVISEGKDHRHGPSGPEIARYLKAQGVKVKSRRVSGKDTAHELISAAKSEKADVLLAGAYTRGRTRDLLFGSVTGELLEDKTLPVLMMHL